MENNLPQPIPVHYDINYDQVPPIKVYAMASKILKKIGRPNDSWLMRDLKNLSGKNAKEYWHNVFVLMKGWQKANLSDKEIQQFINQNK